MRPRLENGAALPSILNPTPMPNRSPASSLRYEPVPEPEDDAAIVRRCLRAFAKDEQRRGAIPDDLPDDVLYAEIEPSVERLTAALRRSPLYPHLTSTCQTEAHIRSLIDSLFG